MNADDTYRKMPPAEPRPHRLSMDDLLTAKSVSGAFGGADTAIAAMQALTWFEG